MRERQLASAGALASTIEPGNLGTTKAEVASDLERCAGPDELREPVAHLCGLLYL
jgi:hypothetical protein